MLFFTLHLSTTLPTQNFPQKGLNIFRIQGTPEITLDLFNWSNGLQGEREVKQAILGRAPIMAEGGRRCWESLIPGCIAK